MPNEKVDTQLSLSLEMPEGQRSTELETGFDPVSETWEIIIKYTGELSAIEKKVSGILASASLSSGFAVLLVKETAIYQLAEQREVIYIDKPKNMFFSLENAVLASCIPPLWRTPLNLSGQGTIACIIDSGIEYTHPDFRTADGDTRILALWDQTIPADTVASWNGNGFLSSPEGYFPGTLFPQEQINAALFAENAVERRRLCPSTDSSGHGTHVAGICAGNGNASNGRYRGCAYQAELLVVKLGRSVNASYPTTTQLMQAADWAVRYASFLGKPIAINISFGNNYGAHDGSSLLEQFLGGLSETWKCSIIAGTGNEGGEGIHFRTKLSVTERTAFDFSCRQGEGSTGSAYGNTVNCPVAELAVAAYETSLNVQIWKRFYDDFEISILPPSGTSRYILPLFPGIQTTILDRVKLFLYYGEPSPFQGKQEIFIQFEPLDDFLSYGIWRFLFRPRRIMDGTVSMWLPSREILNTGTRFLNPSEEFTLTIPSTAPRVISVAAYDELSESPASFSGRGFVACSAPVCPDSLTGGNSLERRQLVQNIALSSAVSVQSYKPELAAPGVSIMAPARGDSYVMKSGTSMAAPFVTGTALLLMEWGIVNGNDAFLYGEKCKAFLISGTEKLPAFAQYPNSSIGYGTLCAQRSIPGVLER